MEQIYVTYGRVQTAADYPAVGNHTALHYVDNNGVDHVIEGGPARPPQGNLFSNVINEEFRSSSDTDSPWGQIRMTERVGGVVDSLLPREPLMTGEDLSAVWSRAREAMTDPTRYWFEQAAAINANDPASIMPTARTRFETGA